MSNRIILDNDALRISKPGVDVLSATDEDLIFDSSATQLPLFMRGTMRVSGSQSVSFGKTFLNVPLVAASIEYSNGNIVCINSEFIILYEGVSGTPFIDFAFKTSASGFSMLTQGSAKRIYYVVWDFDL